MGDYDDSGTISRYELTKVLRDPHSVNVLKSLEVDLDWLKAIQNQLFPTAEAEIAIEDVLDLILRYRGCQTSTVKHLIEVQLFSRWYMTTGLNALAERLEVNVFKLQNDLSWLTRSVA